MIDDLIGISRIESQLSALVRQLRELDRRRLAERPGIWRPNVDIVETAESLEITLELPGVEARDISAEIKAGVLIVKGNKHPPQLPSYGISFICMERRYGEFACEIMLDQDLDFNSASARLSDGELGITFRKLAPGGDEAIRLEING
jgi:HSP20 family molecular chaperone IbpA